MANVRISEKFAAWEKTCDDRVLRLSTNEKRLNELFSKAYEVSTAPCDFSDAESSISRADVAREIRSLLSYAVGCMFGRYSVDEDGLILAGQPFEKRFVYSSVPVTGLTVSGEESMTISKGDCFENINWRA